MKTKKQAIEWCGKNLHLLTNSIKFTPDQIDQFFQAYNLITEENKPRTGCGRCILDMKHRLRQEFAKQKK